MATLPKTMKAWVIPKPGLFKEVLELKRDRPLPAPPKIGEVMIKVSYASINPADIVLMSMRIPCRGAAVPGCDLVGEVVQVGGGPETGSSSSSSRHAIGAIVAGTVPVMSILRGVGVLAEYVVVPAHAFVQTPSAMSETVAAGLMGIAGQTTVALLHAAGPRAGDRVLVNGASGGVGSILVPVLCTMGVRVTAVCSSKNIDLVRKLGAEEVVDYTAPGSLYDSLSSLSTQSGSAPFDALIDCVGQIELYQQSPRYLKPAGKYFTIAGSYLTRLKYYLLPVFLGGVPRTYANLMNQIGGAAAGEAASWFDKGWIKDITIDSIFDMDNALEAYEKLATKRAVGKILVKVQ
ncbi:hypothetical protein BX600DRAFT_461062 [Xylariales sp. PMI_506]|nr:hypothetical protein BX600DRAFT_461062 [Xylariales sp. PMI_506]